MPDSDTTSAIEFFGAASPFGELAGWEPQNGGGESESRQRASALGADGDEIRHADHGERAEVSCAYVSTSATDTGNLTIPHPGQVLPATGAKRYHVDRVSVVYDAEGFPTMTVDGHRHGAGDEGHSGMREYSPSIDLPKVSLGCPDAVGPLSSTGVRSATYTIEASHIDETGGRAKQIGAQNYDGVETVEMTCVNPITLTDSGGDWTKTGNNASKSNTAATENTVTVTRHIAHDTPSQTSE